MKQQFLKDGTGTIRLTIYQDNRPIVPDSGTVTLYNPDGSTLQAAAAVTVNSTTGEMTYSITSTHTATKGQNFKAVWEYVVSSVTQPTETQLFDVVLSILQIPIVDGDIFKELETLRDVMKQANGTATAGAAGSLTDTGRKEVDDFWTGGIIKIISGTGVGQKRVVSDFVQSTGVISVTPNWVTNPDTTSDYVIYQSYTKKIQQAFDRLKTMIYNKGNYHNLIMESSQIREPLITLTIHMVCLDLRKDIDDKWDLLQKEYMDKFKELFNNMKLDYDKDESGFISEEEKQDSINGFEIFRT